MASARALQLVVEELRRGRFAMGKHLRPLLGLLDRVDFSLADSDPYSGSTYSSATFSLTDRWLVSAGMGAEWRFPPAWNLANFFPLMKIQGVIFCLWLAAHAAGAETVVRVLGLHQKSENEVLELIGGRLAHVRSSPASPPLADDAAFLLAQVLHKRWFCRCHRGMEDSKPADHSVSCARRRQAVTGSGQGHRITEGRSEQTCASLCQTGGKGPAIWLQRATLPRGGCECRTFLHPPGPQRQRLLAG